MSKEDDWVKMFVSTLEIGLPAKSGGRSFQVKAHQSLPYANEIISYSATPDGTLLPNQQNLQHYRTDILITELFEETIDQESVQIIIPRVVVNAWLKARTFAA